MRPLVLLIALAFGGCAVSASPVVLDWQGSPDGLVLAREAAQEWSSVCGEPVIVTQGLGAPVTEEAAPFADPDIPGSEWLNGATRIRDRSHDVMWMRIRHFAGERNVLRHEMGHALGYAHTTGGIMAPADDKRAVGDLPIVAADCNGPRMFTR